MNTPNAEATTTEKAASVAEQGAQVAPEKAASKKGATPKTIAPKGPKAAKTGKAKADKPKQAKPATKAAQKAAKPARSTEAGAMRPESKGAKVLELISRSKGATLAEIMKATGWQAHSVRGFISGTLGKKMGLTVASAKREDGQRSYNLPK